MNGEPGRPHTSRQQIDNRFRLWRLPQEDRSLAARFHPRHSSCRAGRRPGDDCAVPLCTAPTGIPPGSDLCF